jgi:hypothetical protein
MPTYGQWDYAQVEIVAENLEDASRRVYDTLMDSNMDPQYQQQLAEVFGSLVNAAWNYNESVINSIDWNDSLDDLFYLDEQLQAAEETLNGYSEEYRVRDDMALLRYYVNELLWQYHANY